MPGAGFKTFNTGDVLTASDVNTYLMQQTVMVFASSAARSTALGANVSEGMLSYLTDTNVVQVYNGSAWVAMDDADAIQNTIVDAKGDLITATAADVPARLGVGANGTVLTADSTTATGLKWATAASGATTFKLSKLFAFGVRGIAYGNSTWVAYGNTGNLETSTDAVTWTARTSGFGSNNIQSVTYGNGIWVAVGSNGTITTSTDLATWTARTSNVSTNTLQTVKYLNSNFIAVGAGANGGTGGITTSTDGITWTKRNTPGTANAATLQDVNFGNGYYVTVGTGAAGDTQMYHSTDLATWTAQSCSTDPLYACFYEQGNWIFLGSNGTNPVYRATNPAGSFTSFSTSNFWNLGVSSTANCYAIRNNLLYLLTPDWHYCMVNGTAINTIYNVFTEYKMPISLPALQRFSGFTSGSPFGNFKCLAVDNNGKLMVVDNNQNRAYIQE